MDQNYLVKLKISTPQPVPLAITCRVQKQKDCFKIMNHSLNLGSAVGLYFVCHFRQEWIRGDFYGSKIVSCPDTLASVPNP